MKSYLKIIPYLICILFASCASDDSHPIQTPRQVNVALTVTLPEPENVQSLARSYTDSEIPMVFGRLSRRVNYLTNQMTRKKNAKHFVPMI